MCTRFSLIKSKDDLLKLNLAKRFMDKYDDYQLNFPIPKYNIPHEAFAHVITNQSPEEIQLFRWGFVPANSKSINVDFYNYLARGDKMFTSYVWKNSARNKRCLVLADGFVEWNKNEKPPVPYRMLINDQQVFAFAGLWETWYNPGHNVSLNTFAIISVDSNATYRNIHHRMPVILDRGEWDAYLNQTDENKILKMINAYDGQKMKFIELTDTINDPDYDGEDAILPNDHATGLQSELF